ncbi:hypothetical protein AWZ03_003307 [Drosophila navojoa]|uniref:Uncharacterized protein n=1 Tax=Drosophila navojoa TaxID=7232 RepID=A0A484BQA3_DRONA|nr:hypothetical protein AWZ03_003307 [Drosophila navojoa]
MSTLDLSGNAVRGGTQVSLLSSPLSIGQWPKLKNQRVTTTTMRGQQRRGAGAIGTPTPRHAIRRPL